MHHPENQVETERDDVILRRQRIGLILLSLFTLAYAGFIYACTFAHAWLARTQVFELPLSIVYGVGLIASAIGIAFLYGRLSRN